MIVCHCNAISDRVVRAVIARGARDVSAVTRACGAGSDCGGCSLRIERILIDEVAIDLRVAS